MDRSGRTHDRRRGAPVESRLKMPQGNEVVGRIMRIAGATNFVVKCVDGKERLCTIPGRLRRMFWIKTNDVVIVKPWIVQSDVRGDIVWRYSLLDISRLKDNNMLPNV
jgi:translation initiation factor 1A